MRTKVLIAVVLVSCLIQGCGSKRYGAVLIRSDPPAATASLPEEGMSNRTPTFFSWSSEYLDEAEKDVTVTKEGFETSTLRCAVEFRYRSREEAMKHAEKISVKLKPTAAQATARHASPVMVDKGLGKQESVPTRSESQNRSGSAADRVATASQEGPSEPETHAERSQVAPQTHGGTNALNQPRPRGPQPHDGDVQKQETGATSVHDAAKNGDLGRLKQLIAQGVPVNSKDAAGLTPLHFAAYNGRTDVVEWLITKGAEVDGTAPDGTTALIIASAAGHLEVVNTLVSKGASVNTKAKNGATALYAASQEGHELIVGILLSKGAEPNVSGQNSGTPLYIASQKGYGTIVKQLLQHGAEPNVKAVDGSSPLHVAAIGGFTAIVTALLDHGADVNAKANDGGTALLAASYAGHVSAVRTLLERGATVNLTNNKGMTPLSVARDETIARMLAERDRLAQGTSKESAPASDGIVLSTSDEKTGWTTPDERVYFADSMGLLGMAIHQTVNGRAVSCPIAFQDVAYVLDKDGQKADKLTISAYRGVAFRIPDELRVVENREMREEVVIEIDSIEQGIFLTNKASAVPFVQSAQGIDLDSSAVMFRNVTWKFPRSMTFSAGSSQYIVEKVDATISFTKDGVRLNGVRIGNADESRHAATTVPTATKDADPMVGIHKLVGRWMNRAGGIIEFTADETVKLTFPFKVSNSLREAGHIDGVIIDVGFLGLQYAPYEKYPSRLRMADDVRPAELAFANVDENRDLPVARVVLFAGEDGMCKLWETVNGRRVDGFKTDVSGPVLAVLYVDDKQHRVKEARFTAVYVDRTMTWNGEVAVDARCRPRGENEFELYVPVATSSVDVDLLVAQGSLEGAEELVLTWTSIKKDRDQYSKSDDSPTHQDSRADVFILDPKEIAGVLVNEKPAIYVNTGLTLNRVQNAMFRLPGREILGPINETEFREKQEVPPLIIRRGAN